jgi:hypothetical protein
MVANGTRISEVLFTDLKQKKMDKDKLKGVVASELIIVAMETKGKRPTQLNFEEMIYVVSDVVNKISVYPMLADSLPLSKNCEYFNSDECDCMDGFCHYGEKR